MEVLFLTSEVRRQANDVKLALGGRQPFKQYFFKIFCHVDLE